MADYYKLCAGELKVYTLSGGEVSSRPAQSWVDTLIDSQPNWLLVNDAPYFVRADYSMGTGLATTWFPVIGGIAAKGFTTPEIPSMTPGRVTATRTKYNETSGGRIYLDGLQHVMYTPTVNNNLSFQMKFTIHDQWVPSASLPITLYSNGNNIGVPGFNLEMYPTTGIIRITASGIESPRLNAEWNSGTSDFRGEWDIGWTLSPTELKLWVNGSFVASSLNSYPTPRVGFEMQPTTQRTQLFGNTTEASYVEATLYHAAFWDHSVDSFPEYETPDRPYPVQPNARVIDFAAQEYTWGEQVPYGFVDSASHNMVAWMESTPPTQLPVLYDYLDWGPASTTTGTKLGVVIRGNFTVSQAAEIVTNFAVELDLDGPFAKPAALLTIGAINTATSPNIRVTADSRLALYSGNTSVSSTSPVAFPSGEYTLGMFYDGNTLRFEIDNSVVATLPWIWTPATTHSLYTVVMPNLVGSQYDGKLRGLRFDLYSDTF